LYFNYCLSSLWIPGPQSGLLLARPALAAIAVIVA